MLPDVKFYVTELVQTKVLTCSSKLIWMAGYEVFQIMQKCLIMLVGFLHHTSTGTAIVFFQIATTNTTY